MSDFAKNAVNFLFLLVCTQQFTSLMEIVQVIGMGFAPQRGMGYWE